MLMIPVWLCVGFTNVSTVKWPFLNKVAVHSYLTPFKVSEDDKAKMISSGFIQVC